MGVGNYQEADIREGARAFTGWNFKGTKFVVNDAQHDATGGEGGNQRYLDCYGRGGEPCGRCGDELRRTVIDARATVFCPSCQRRGG